MFHVELYITISFVVTKVQKSIDISKYILLICINIVLKIVNAESPKFARGLAPPCTPQQLFPLNFPKKLQKAIHVIIHLCQKKVS